MIKQQKIQKHFNQKEKLTLKNKVYLNQVKKYLTNCLADDLGNKGDITSNTLIKGNPKAKAVIIAKQAGIIAGIEEIKWFILDYRLQISDCRNDGEFVKKGQKIITLSGKIKDILKTERTILNLLQHMSGIATETNKITRLAGKSVLICSTRKTPLGLLDKKAVTVGGGGTHRLGLYDWILVKDNHLKISNLQSAICNLQSFYEIEVKNKNEAIKAVKLNPDAIMFDNMRPKQIKNIIKILNPSTKLRASKYNQNIIFEASGGINEKNIREYVKTGVDVISLGYLTHSAKALDLSLDIVI